MADVRQPDDAAREAAATADRNNLTKAELLEIAQAQGIDIPASATKADILEALASL